MSNRTLFLIVAGIALCFASCSGSKHAFVPPDPTHDDDNDGINNGDEGSGNPGGPTDTDGDGIPDYKDTDSDGDGMLDEKEGTFDNDGDTIPGWRDPRNDGPAQAITLRQISTNFNSPIGIDHHEFTNSVIISVNYPDVNSNLQDFERIDNAGAHHAFSNVVVLNEEVKIATARPDNPAGFPVGTLFVGNGVDGQITRISPDGMTVTNPWVDLPGSNNGLMRGSLYVDQTGIFGGDLIAVTTVGEVWRINANAVPTPIRRVGLPPPNNKPAIHFEGVIVVPNGPARFGPLAGKIITGAEDLTKLYAFDVNGNETNYDVGVKIEDIDIVPINENFFGVAYGSSKIYGAAYSDFVWAWGDIFITSEYSTLGNQGLFRLKWDGSNLSAEAIPITPSSATTAHWEHTTFSRAGIVEIPPV